MAEDLKFKFLNNKKKSVLIRTSYTYSDVKSMPVVMCTDNVGTL